MKQGKRSQNGSFCAYRGKGGTKCAVGCLIPDSMYNLQMDLDAINVTSLFAQYPEVREYLGNQQFLLRLQYVHDNIPSVRWKRAFTDTAQYHGLTVPDIA